MAQEMKKCPYAAKCGGCQYQGMDYQQQLKEKQKMVGRLLREAGRPEPIIGILPRRDIFSFPVPSTKSPSCEFTFRRPSVIIKENCPAAGGLRAQRKNIWIFFGRC